MKHHHNEILYFGHHLHRPCIVHFLIQRRRNEISWQCWNSRRQTSRNYGSNDQFERYKCFIFFWKQYFKIWYFQDHLEFIIALFSEEQERQASVCGVDKTYKTFGKCYQEECGGKNGWCDCNWCGNYCGGCNGIWILF